MFNERRSQPRGVSWSEVPTNRHTLDIRHGAACWSNIQQGKLFHVNVTYGCIPKHVERDGTAGAKGVEAGVRWLDCGAAQWNGCGGKRRRVRNERNSNMQRISYKRLGTTQPSPKQFRVRQT